MLTAGHPNRRADFDRHCAIEKWPICKCMVRSKHRNIDHVESTNEVKNMHDDTTATGAAGETSRSGEGRKVNSQPLHAARIPDALLTLRTAGAVSGLSASTIYRKAASDPTFPKLVRMGKRCTRIRAGDLTAWLAAQAA